jgi:hypothetical protein
MDENQKRDAALNLKIDPKVEKKEFCDQNLSENGQN